MELNLDSLLNQPHILIAGTTGSGKSNLLHYMIDYLLNYTPVTFCMIDPKRVELSLYKNYGNTQGYACEIPEIITTLDGVILEMENRYKYMQARALREYPGCYIYLIIDELADIMTTAKKDVLPRLQRILQLGRAANIHVIAATQAPDRTYTLPALLKLNFTDRIALRCATAIESKQIIDRPGAETLPQYGQAIYRNCIGNCTLVDIPYISTEHIQKKVFSARIKFKEHYMRQLLKNKNLYKRLYPEDFNIFGFRKLTSKNS